jgi:dienelactone hydrolase
VAEIVLFHHAQGLTMGCIAFADELRAAGHIVHVPDLYDGNTFTDLDEGMAYGKQLGFDKIVERGLLAAESLPGEIVYAGFSLGVMSAQKLAQTRPGAKGAVLMHAAVPLDEFGGAWPDGVPLQMHTMEDDEWGDADIAKELADQVDGAELFLYPGDRHLFTDNSLADYDEGAAALVTQRVLGFLDKIE